MLNSPINDRNDVCRANLFYLDEFEGPRFLKSVSCRFSDLFQAAVASLTRAGIGTNDVLIGHFRGKSKIRYFKRADIQIGTFGAKENMTIWIKSVNLSKAFSLFMHAFI